MLKNFSEWWTDHPPYSLRINRVVFQIFERMVDAAGNAYERIADRPVEIKNECFVAQGVASEMSVMRPMAVFHAALIGTDSVLTSVVRFSSRIARSRNP